jgi:predicted transcriptional regulator
MSERVTIELPDDLSRRARKLAAAGNRRLEDALIDGIDRAVAEPAVEALPDDELLRLCDATLEAGDQAELSDRLADAREGNLDDAGRVRLDELMAEYRRGLVLKARAWKEAVSRGLRTPPTDTEAADDHAA